MSTINSALRSRTVQPKIVTAVVERLRAAVPGYNDQNCFESDQPVPAAFSGGRECCTVSIGAGSFPHEFFAGAGSATLVEDGSPIITPLIEVRYSPGCSETSSRRRTEPMLMCRVPPRRQSAALNIVPWHGRRYAGLRRLVSVVGLVVLLPTAFFFGRDLIGRRQMAATVTPESERPMAMSGFVALLGAVGASRLMIERAFACWAVFAATALLAGNGFAQFRFQHHFGDRDLQGRNMGQTALADLNGDGKLDFITGEQTGDIFWYEYRAPDDWRRHLLGTHSPSDVGGAAMDVDGDGRMDFVAGGAWYQNPGDATQQPFRRHVFDAELNSVHDIIVGDIDGDGRLDVITMADTRRSPTNELRWHRIADDPTDRWTATRIGPPTHSGISLGDIDGDGDQDVVRSNVWFENRDKGKAWTMHQMTPPWGASQPSFAVNATQTETADLNGDGRLDVVICDGENPDSKIAWLESPADPRRTAWPVHNLPRSDDDPRGALHSLRLADFNDDGRLEILAVEMERFPGVRPPRWFLWENDGKGTFTEHVILDANLGGHETVAGDVDGDGDVDICSKPWTPNRSNAIGGKSHFSYLENLHQQPRD